MSETPDVTDEVYAYLLTLGSPGEMVGPTDVTAMLREKHPDLDDDTIWRARVAANDALDRRGLARRRVSQNNPERGRSRYVDLFEQKEM